MNEQKLTAQIIQALRGNLPEWKQAWQGDENLGVPTNFGSHCPYTGGNALKLKKVAEQRGYASKWWGTEQQWVDVGVSILPPPDYIRDSDWGVQIKGGTVYNVEQVWGTLVDDYRAVYKNYEEDVIFARAEHVVAATGADIRVGDKAWYYRPPVDYIICPRREQFESPRHYYLSLYHELAHWAEVRVGWDHKDRYGLGELVAEIAGVLIASRVGVPPTDAVIWQNFYSYLNYWAKTIGADEETIRAAAAQAGKVADFILSFSDVEQGVCHV